MPIDVVVKSEFLTAEARSNFEGWSRGVWAGLARIAAGQGIPACRVQAVLTDDFVGEVSRLSGGKPPGAPEFTVERVGGTAVGKNISLSEDGSEVAVILDATTWNDHHEPQVKLLNMLLIGHELAHPWIERGRIAAGLYEGVSFPSVTSTEIARSMSSILSGEYRADYLSDMIVRPFFSTGNGTERQPIGGWDILGDGYMEHLEDVLGAAHPGWADLVDEYRYGRIDLESMWENLVSRLDQTLNLLIHAQSHADAAEVPDPITLEPIRSLAAVRLYLAESCAAFVSMVREAPLLPRVEETLRWEEDIRAVGEESIRRIWKRLGITATDNPDRSTQLDVEAPLTEDPR